MKVRSQILSTSVARGIVALCAAVLVGATHTAQAGIDVWTSNGPGGGDVRALAIDPITPRGWRGGVDSHLHGNDESEATPVGKSGRKLVFLAHMTRKTVNYTEVRQ